MQLLLLYWHWSPVFLTKQLFTSNIVLNYAQWSDWIRWFLKKLYKLKQHNISKPFCTLKLQCVWGILKHRGHRCSFIYLFIFFERGLQRKNSCKIWLQKEEDFFFYIRIVLSCKSIKFFNTIAIECFKYINRGYRLFQIYQKFKVGLHKNL